jgi:DNA repair protein RecN (Recombination protein N)
MLIELRIKNFAIIDALELSFEEGLTIFTGETGAGKSIIIDAVETLLGVRADPTLIREGVDSSIVEGTFKIDLKKQKAINKILVDEDLLEDDNYVTLSREFRREGRNIVRVNGRTVGLGILKSLGSKLIDLHGQSEHLSLLQIPSHILLLDRYANHSNLLAEYQGYYKSFQSTRREIKKIKRAEADSARQSDLLKFQAEEITDTALTVGEDAQLLQERNRLSNAESLAVHANSALSSLDSTDPESISGLDVFGQVLSSLESLIRVDDSQQPFLSQAEELFEGTSDLIGSLRNYLEEIEFNPTRLEEVDDRLVTINDLKRKYGASIEEIIIFGENAAKSLEDIVHAEEKSQQLQREEIVLRNQLSTIATRLSASRKEAGEKLSRAVERELQDLKMDRARFGVAFTQNLSAEGIENEAGEIVSFEPNGIDFAEFMVAPNPGEGLKPLVKIASGGETARLMLAIKNELAKADDTPTLIFDEIDQGIGGRVGAVVGQKLWQLAKSHQVLCITHLAQMAGYADQHFVVAKDIHDGRTTTVVNQIGGEDRMIELAKMLGDVSDGTLQSASEILQSVRLETNATISN